MSLAFVLIHGGGLDTWVWEPLTPLLNFPALAVHRAATGTNLNRLTITDCAKYIQSQDEMAANIGAKILTLDTGHTAMLSRPNELAKLLNGIASEIVVK